MTSIQRYFMRSRPPPGEQITLNSSSSSSADDEDETEDSNDDTDSGTAEGVEQPTGVASEESNADTAIAGDPEVSASCPICMEPWTSSGKHRISCLPCGHLFGESCIRRWLKQGNSTRKCPQCNRKCKLNDIRKLYAEKLIVVDGEIMQERDVLRTNNERLVLENRTLKTEKDSVTQERDTYLKEVEQLRSQNEQLIEEMHKLQQQQALTSTNMYEEYSNHSGSLYKRRRIGPEYLQAASDNGLLACGSTQFSGICIKPIFSLQSQSPLHGAKHFDIDAISQMTLISQKTSEIGSVHILRKMSLLVLAEGEQIFLPPETGAVRDIRIAPSGTVHSGRLALVAAKKLSIISFQSNNVSLTYELQIPAWSCAWDLNDSNQVYAGLQNGNVLVFDIRNTRTPLRSFEGLSTHPIHTLYSIAASSMQRSQIIERTVMGASVVGPSVFLVDGPPSKPSPVPGLEHSGVCISLAYNGMTNMAVASYRPKSGSHGNSSLTSPNSIFPSQYACSQAVIASQYCGTSTQVSNSPTKVSNSPTAGYHYVLMQNGINNQNEEGNQTTISGGGETYCHGWKFNHDKVMHGNVSPWGISKSVLFSSFVPGSGSQHFFAHGDECKKAVSVFDLHSSSIMETLEPHQDKIIDIKHCTIGGKGVLGSVSENKLQIYTCQH